MPGTLPSGRPADRLAPGLVHDLDDLPGRRPEGPYHNDARGAAGPYYAALNLIMLAVSAVGHWSLLETGLAVGSVIGMYLLACLARGYGNQNFGMLFNNLYFLALTGVIVVCGNYLFNRLRFREFALRYELDKQSKGPGGIQPETPRARPGQEPLLCQHQP